MNTTSKWIGIIVGLILCATGTIFFILTCNQEPKEIITTVPVYIYKIEEPEDYSSLKETNSFLLEQNNEYKAKYENIKAEYESLKLELESSKQEPIVYDETDFKSYMPYTAITDTSSYQWQLQQQAQTNELGLRTIDNIPLVAIGTGWNISVGERAIVYCANGNQFNIIVGDIKQDAHTLDDNKTGAANGCRVEFIVDMGSLDYNAKIRGNIAVIDKYNGYVTNIVRVDS